MSHYDDEFGNPYGDSEPHWLTNRELLRLAAGAIAFWGAAIALGCAAWWLV